MAVATATIIAGLGLAVAAAGTAVTAYGSYKASKAQKKQERIRQRSAELDYMRRRREIIRKMIAARALGISNAVSQGAGVGDSSVQGGIAQATQTANVAAADLSQNKQLGDQMFAAQASESSARGTTSFGGALQSWGSGLIQNSEMISRVGQSYGFWKNSYGPAKGFA